jgi:hypothetical protein
MKKTVALSALLLATACGTQQPLTAAKIRAAMPRSAVVSVNAPDPGAPVGAVLLASPGSARGSSAAAGNVVKAPVAVVSYVFATTINAGVVWALLPVTWFVDVVPPTRCDHDSCTWGPGSKASELNDWKLVVTRAGDGYDWALSGKPKSNSGAPFTAVLSGRAYPGALPARGHGSFHADFDGAWAALDHAAGEAQQDFGSLAIDYDARAGVRIDATFLAARNNDDPGAPAAPGYPNRTNAVYAFAADPAGGAGDLQLGFRNVAYDAGHAAAIDLDTKTLHTRWKVAGGRGDVVVKAPAPDNTAVSFSQCWNGAPDYAMTFDGTRAVGDPLRGDAGLCAYADALPVTISVP